jgi:hypothetical protein
MEANMREKLLMSFGLIILGLLSGCADMGAVKSTSDDPPTSELGTLMYDEGSQEQRIRESEAGRSQINVNAQAQSTQQDLRVNKKDNEKYWKIDTSSDIYIDNNLIPEDEISHETESIYSILLQDASISIRSGENAQSLYVEELKKIDLQLAPPEFNDVFEKHIDAWERDSTDEINSTMDEILRVALKYGVRMKE